MVELTTKEVHSKSHLIHCSFASLSTQTKGDDIKNKDKTIAVKSYNGPQNAS